MEDHQHDPLAKPVRDLATVEQIMPEKPAFLGLWHVSDSEMATWDMETFISSAMTARSVGDLSNWVLGRLALGLEKTYGKDSLGEFAKDIGVPKASLAVYRWVAQAYEDCLDTDLTIVPYSYYRLAAGTDNAMDWILKAAEDNLSYEALKFAIDESLGRIKDEDGEPVNKPKVVKCEECGGWQIINTDNLCGGHLDALQKLDAEPVEGEIVEDSTK